MSYSGDEETAGRRAATGAVSVVDSPRPQSAQVHFAGERRGRYSGALNPYRSKSVV